MVREIDLDDLDGLTELTCQTCDKTHSDFHKEVYNHARHLSPIIVCDKCGCGTEPWKY